MVQKRKWSGSHSLVREFMEIVPMKRVWGRCLAKGYGDKGFGIVNKAEIDVFSGTLLLFP